MGSKSAEPVRDTLLEFAMTPLDKGSSVSHFVARSLDIIDRSGLPYRLGPMGTTVEGSWSEVQAVMTQCFERMREDCERISVSVKIDHRRGRTGRLTAKLRSVENKIGRPLHTGESDEQ